MPEDIFVIQSPKSQAIGESIAYSVDFADLGTPASAGTTAAYNDAGTDVTATTLTGANSIASAVITTGLFSAATAGTYRLVVSATISSNTIYGALDVVVYDPKPAAASNSYCTVAEFKAYAIPEGKSSAIDDGVVRALIESASKYVESFTGRTFRARTETHYFDTPEDRELWFDDDLLSVTTLTNGDGTTIAASAYKFMPYNTSPKYALFLLASSGIAWQTSTAGDAEGAISLAGSWGYSATAPADVKEATLVIASSAYKRRFGENVTSTSLVTAAGVVITPEDIPDKARQILEHYRRIM